MSPPYIAPVIDSTAIFQADIFKGKVLFCTGGGSGICREMTEAMVCSAEFIMHVKIDSCEDAPWN